MTSRSTSPIPRHITARPPACPTLPSASRIDVSVQLGVRVTLGTGVPVVWASTAQTVGARGYRLQVLHPGAPRVATQVIDVKSGGDSKGLVVHEPMDQLRATLVSGLAVSMHQAACPYETITFNNETISDPAREHGASLAGDLS